MRVHHLNCATMCPRPAALLGGGRMVCHCLLVETNKGLVLVDTGLSLDDVRDPARLGRSFGLFARPRLDPEETAVRRVAALGLAPRDVRHLVPTHLDPDHAAGFSDFKEAEVHVFEPEHAAAMKRETLNERHRYLPALWSHGPRFQIHATAAARVPWFGFDAIRLVEGMEPEILLVPASGHTRGHCAVAVETDSGWLLHCGDAYFFRTEMDANPSCPIGFRFFQRLLEVDRARRLETQAKLRALRNDPLSKVRLFCAHDGEELARFQADGATSSRDASLA